MFVFMVGNKRSHSKSTKGPVIIYVGGGGGWVFFCFSMKEKIKPIS